MDIHKKYITLYIYSNKQKEILFILSSFVYDCVNVIYIIYISSMIKSIYEMQMKHGMKIKTVFRSFSSTNNDIFYFMRSLFCSVCINVRCKNTNHSIITTKS